MKGELKLVWTLFLLIFTIVEPFKYEDLPYVIYQESDAISVAGLERGTKQYMRILYEQPDYVLVGAKNMLYNISTFTMEVQASYSWESTTSHEEKCMADLEFHRGDCNSYIRTIRENEDGNLIVCASSAKVPACRQLIREGNGWSFSSWTESETVQAYAPIFPWEDLLLYNAENSVYVATNWYSGVVPYFALFRDSFLDSDGSTVNAMSTLYQEKKGVINDDLAFGVQPQYRKIFETEDHVYLLFIEPALETYTTQKTVYSRIARVCKNDRGNSNLERGFAFVTFYKSRLLCGIPEVPMTERFLITNDTTGYYSYYFNELAAATDIHVDAVNGERVLIAAFNNPKNSIGGSAICMYKVSDIEKVFENSLLDPITGLRASQPPARCPAQSTRDMSNEQVSRSEYPLLREPVRAVNNATLFIRTGTNYGVTQVLVDWMVEGPDGKNRSVIFVSTDDGKLLKLVNFQKPEENEARYHTVEEREIFPGKPIKEMQMITDSNGKKHLLLNTYSSIKRVAVEKCHRYTSCEECMAIRDPYCSWSTSTESCVSTSHSAKNKFQSIETGEHDICGTYTTPTSASEVVTKGLEDDSKVKDDDNEIIKTPALNSQKQIKMGGQNTALVVVAIVLPIVFLAIGFAGGFFYNRYRNNRSNTSHLDELSEQRHKKMIDRSDSDAYQEMPSNLNKINYKNNLTPKTPNSQANTDNMPQFSESTLTRTKKSYV